jgi:hypothetical protein
MKPVHGWLLAAALILSTAIQSWRVSELEKRVAVLERAQPTILERLAKLALIVRPFFDVEK